VGGHGPDDDSRWWDGLVTNVGRLMFATVATLGTQFLLTEPVLPRSTYFGMAQIAWLTAVAAFARPLRWKLRGILLVVALLVFGFIGDHDVGPRPAVLLSFETAAVLTALMFGGRAGMAVQGAAALALFVAGHLARPQAAALLAADIGRTSTQVRMSFAYFLIGGVTVVLVSAAFRRMGQSLAQTRAAEGALRESDERLRFALDAAAVGTWSMDLASGLVDWSRNVDRVLGVPREALPRTRAESLALVHPDDREAVAAEIADVEAGRTPDFRAEHRLITAEGRVRWVDTRARIRTDGRTGARRLTGTMVDVTARRTLEARRREAQATLLALAGSAAVRRGDRAAALRELTEAGTSLLGTARCGVWLLEEGDTSLRCLDLYEARPGRHSSGAAVAVGSAPAYFQALARQRAIAADDARADPRTRELDAGYLTPLGISAMLDAPVFLEGRMAGVICHEHVGSGPRAWTAEEQGLAGSLADCVARALEALARADGRRRLERAYDELGALSRRMETAKEEERRRIAHELHDELGQTVTAMKINLQIAAGAAGPGRDTGWIADMVALADRTIQVVRRLVQTLRPPLLDELGLVVALRALLEEQERRAGLRCTLEAPEALRALPDEIAMAAFRVVQESVDNALLHAHARAVAVTLRRPAERLEIVVRDDGGGFDVEAALARALDGNSLGLVGMRERARALGGTFSVSSRLGAGTEVRVELPVMPLDASVNSHRDQAS
jgi:PAS domain S-box-containing protein